MAISKRIIDQAGGNIEIASGEEKGSRFIITIEMETTKLEGNELKLDYELLNNLRVMLIDDNNGSRLVLRDYLEKAGCIIYEATDCLQAIKMLEAMNSDRLPGVILIDYQLPYLNGIETARIVAENQKLIGIKLILMYTRVQRSSLTAMNENRFSGYLSKPVRRMELFSEIIAALGSRKESLPLFISQKTFDEKVNSAKGLDILLR